MPPDDMIPKMFFNQGVLALDEHDDKNDTENGEQDIHPCLVQQVHSCKCAGTGIFSGMVFMVKHPRQEGGYETCCPGKHGDTFPS